MKHKKELRDQVVRFVEQGGRKAEAARKFGVSRPTIDSWIKSPPTKPSKEVDLDRLKISLAYRPDLPLSRRAQHLDTTPYLIKKAIRKIEKEIKKKIL